MKRDISITKNYVFVKIKYLVCDRINLQIINLIWYKLKDRDVIGPAFLPGDNAHSIGCFRVYHSILVLPGTSLYLKILKINVFNSWWSSSHPESDKVWPCFNIDQGGYGILETGGGGSLGNC